MGPAFQLILAFPCRRKRRVLLSPRKFDGQASRCPVGAFSVAMFEQAAVRVLAHADVVGSVTTAKNVAVMHRILALRLAQNAGSLRTTFSPSEKVGGGGSCKAYRPCPERSRREPLTRASFFLWVQRFS